MDDKKVSVIYTRKRGEIMRFVSWNVNGLRAIYQKDFPTIFNQFEADFICLQETKMQEGQLDFNPEGYFKYFNYAEKKGYSGTAIYTKHEPLSVNYGIQVDQHDHEGRVITLEYETFYIVCVYTPNAQDELRRLSYRMEWENDFRAYLVKLDQTKPVIVCGDLNVAHEEIDLKNPNSNHNNPGFSDEERAQFTKFLEAGFVDSFRYLYPDKEQYSWWSYRMRARERNVGWRIDYFVVSDRIAKDIDEALIHDDIFGSDHCPVSLDIF